MREAMRQVLFQLQTAKVLTGALNKLQIPFLLTNFALDV